MQLKTRQCRIPILQRQ